MIEPPLKKTKIVDPIIDETPGRFSMFPISDTEIWSAFKASEAAVWTAQEIDFSQDTADWKKMTPDQRHFIKHVLAFFASSDGVVIENLMLNVMSTVKLPEARAFYGFQTHIENVHSETYSLLIETYVQNHEEKIKLFHAIDTIPTVKKKAEWALKWAADKFGTRLVAFACVEGIMFSSSFAAIFWLRTKNMLPGLCHANELIARDEGIHSDFAVLLYGKLKEHNRPSHEVVKRLVAEAVKLEKEFATEALPVRLMGINAKAMCTYIEFVADRLLTQLGCGALYAAKNPFPFMEAISIDGKTNFFERRVSEYQRVAPGEFQLDADF